MRVRSVSRSLLPFGTLHSVPSRQPYPHDHDGASLLADLNFRPSPAIYPAPSPTTSSFLPSLQHPPAKPSPRISWGSTPSLDHYCLSAYCISGPSRQPNHNDHDGAGLLVDLSFRLSPNSLITPSLPSHQALSSPVRPSAPSLHTQLDSAGRRPTPTLLPYLNELRAVRRA